MESRTCTECGCNPAEYHVIHPEHGRPVWVCACCEELLAEGIAARQAELARGSDVRELVGQATGADEAHSATAA